MRMMMMTMMMHPRQRKKRLLMPISIPPMQHAAEN